MKRIVPAIIVLVIALVGMSTAAAAAPVETTADDTVAVMPGDNVAVMPGDNVKTPEDRFLKAKKAFLENPSEDRFLKAKKAFLENPSEDRFLKTKKAF